MISMHVKIFDKTEVVVALGAARAVTPAPSLQQDSLLTAVAGLHGVDLCPQLLPKPGVLRMDRVLRERRCCRRVVELATALATSEGDLRSSAPVKLVTLARTLDHSDSDVRRFRDLASHYYLRSRIDFTRRMAARVFSDGQPSGQESRTHALLGSILRARSDRMLAGRYHALAELHPASFGYAVWEHYRRNGFRFPGEGGGVPERLLTHDVAHVLTGYSTDAEGELLQAAFQTGCSRADGFMPLYFGILQFQFAARVTASVKDGAPVLDFAKLEAALARGASCRADLTDDWDFWALLPRPLGEVRQSLGVPPLGRSRAA